MEEEKEKQLIDCATKIYAAAEEAYRKLLDLRFSPLGQEEREKFRELMHEKNFGKFVQTLKSKTGLCLTVGNHNLGPDYIPMKEHIEKIKQILAEQGKNWVDVAQEILTRIGTITIIGRQIQRDVLYPEISNVEEKIEKLENESNTLQAAYSEALKIVDIIDEKEKKIEELKERLKEKDKQLRFSLDTWLYFMHGIESDIQHANPRIYAMMNEIGKE